MNPVCLISQVALPLSDSYDLLDVFIGVTDTAESKFGFNLYSFTVILVIFVKNLKKFPKSSQSSTPMSDFLQSQALLSAVQFVFFMISLVFVMLVVSLVAILVYNPMIIANFIIYLYLQLHRTV